MEQFNSLYYKFSYADRDVLAFLFRTYTSSFYAIENWNFGTSSYPIRKISVAYHKAVKRVSGMNVWQSNHDACKVAGVNTFKHLYAKRRVNFLFSLRDSKSPCLTSLRYYLCFQSFIRNQIVDYFRDVYEVPNLLENPLCAIRARIDFVERNEPSSGSL